MLQHKIFYRLHCRAKLLQVELDVALRNVAGPVNKVTTCDRILELV